MRLRLNTRGMFEWMLLEHWNLTMRSKWQLDWWERIEKGQAAEARRCPGQVQWLVWIYESDEHLVRVVPGQLCGNIRCIPHVDFWYGISALGDIEVLRNCLLSAFLLGFGNECSYGKVSDLNFATFADSLSEFGFHVWPLLESSFWSEVFDEGQSTFIWFSNFNMFVAVLPQGGRTTDKRKKARHLDTLHVVLCVCGKRDCIRCHFTESELVVTWVLWTCLRVLTLGGLTSLLALRKQLWFPSREGCELFAYFAYSKLLR